MQAPVPVITDLDIMRRYYLFPVNYHIGRASNLGLKLELTGKRNHYKLNAHILPDFGTFATLPAL
jgi:hypothetical protein